MSRRIYIYDTTLRDGAQGEGISFSSADKIRIAERLDVFGIDYIEGGWPGSNPKDMDFSPRRRRGHSSTRRLRPSAARAGRIRSARTTRRSTCW
jgi:isopropylmalate/homocitrate/citramalate synthase